MKKNIFLMAMILLYINLYAGSTSPLIRPSSNNIVDLGYYTNSDRPNTIPKIWAQYEGIIEMVENVIIGKSRIYQEKELCISDSRLVENCPIDKVDCSAKWELTDGTANKVTIETTRVAVENEVQSCSEDASTRCEYFDYTKLATSQTETISATATLHYDYATPNYSCDSPYELDDNYYGYGYKRCVIVDDTKEITDTKPKECYKDGGGSGFPQCFSLSDWKTVEPYYVGGILGECSPSPIIENETVCEANYNYISGCSDFFTRAFYPVDAQWPTCIKTKPPNLMCPYPYSSNGVTCQLYTDTTYSCPLGWEGPSDDNMCTRNIQACPEGWEGPDEQNNCFYDGYRQYKCTQNEVIQGSDGEYICPFSYHYYDYNCPDDNNTYNIPWSLEDKGGNCNTCLYDGCVCNSSAPPKNNCKREIYVCPYDDSRLCTELPASGENSFQDVPMIDHNIEGEPFALGEYGTLREASCGETCDFAISKIESSGESLCFYNRTGEERCIKVSGCTFSGNIYADTDRHISSIALEVSTDPKTMIFYDDTIQGIGSITSSCSLNGGVSYPNNKGKIISFVIDGAQIKFWDSYEQRGDIGFIEILDDVPDEYKERGFEPAPEEAYALRNKLFDRIFYFDTGTFAISSKSMTEQECDAAGESVEFDPLEISQLNANAALDNLMNNYVGPSVRGNLSGGTYEVPAQCFGETGRVFGEDYVFNNPKTSYNKGLDQCERATGDITQRCQVTFQDWCHPEGETIDLEIESGDVKRNIVMVAGSQFIINVNDDCTYAGKPSMLSSGCGYKVDEGFPPDAIAEAYNIDVTRNYYYNMSGEGLGEYLNQLGTSGLQFLTLRDASIDTTAVDTERPQCQAGYLYRTGMACHIPTVENRCVLYRSDNRSFSAAEYARKILDEYSTYGRYFCSPYTCLEHSCRVADCEEGYLGTLINDDLKPLQPEECTQQRCDANQPHYEFCGKRQGCPEHIDGIIEDASGRCIRTVCNEGGYNPQDMQCYKWQCPLGSIESGDQCVSD